MKKTIILILLLASYVCQVFAQKNLELEPAPLVENSLYDKVEYLDSRINPNDLGYVNGGFLSGFKNVVENPPIAVQLKSLMSSMINESAENGNLYFQLRDFRFYQVMRDRDEIGQCKIRINLYSKDGDNYYFINRIDTIIEAKTKEILEVGSAAFVDVLAKNLTVAPLGDVPFSMAQIQDIDEFEKEDLPLYINKTFADGLYPTFEAFINQEPDTRELQTKLKKNELKEVKIFNSETRKWRKLKPEHLYAVVIDGRLYISYYDKYYLGYFDGNDVKFSFQRAVGGGRGVSVGIGMGGGSRGGGIGGGVGFTFGGGQKETIIMKIDHLDGEAIVAN